MTKVPSGLGAHHVRALRILEVEGKAGAHVAVHTRERSLTEYPTISQAHVGFLARRELIRISYPGHGGRDAFITDAGRAVLTAVEEQSA